MPYLCAHFREKTTPDGEQVYFAVSADGLSWEALNGGRPVLEASLGEKGCRDIEVVRLSAGGFAVITTDLAIARRAEKGPIDWKYINSHGSKCLRIWKSPDLISFGEERLVHMGRDDFGCLWAPEAVFDRSSGRYMLHWGSTVGEDGFSHMSIYCSYTSDFESFAPPELFFEKDNEILDSHITYAGDSYFLFYKNSSDPAMNMLSVTDRLRGGRRVPVESFTELMSELDAPGAYEGPTTYVLPDGRWALWLDFFGCEKEKMGYVPFISPAVGDIGFRRADPEFSFPYGFKHGRVIDITDEEYLRLKENYSL